MKPIFYALSALLAFSILSAAFAKTPATAKIAFTSNRDGNFEIYIMNPDGSEQVNLTEHRATDYNPVWSPTGEQILFVSNRHGIKDLYLMNADGTNARKVFQKLVGRQHPTWAPDGKQFAYHRLDKLSIYTALSDGKDEEKLASGLWPVWSPNGSEIAYVADEKFLLPAEGVLQVEKPKIQIINLQTNVEEILIPGKNLMFGPAWAPNSAKIAFSWIDLDAVDLLAGKEIEDTESVYIVNRDGSELKQIVAADDGASSHPIWTPQGDELVYEKLIRDTVHLFKIDLGGGISEQLTRQGDNLGADWFDPAFALPVSPQLQLLTTVWAKMKIGN
jgi:Tol biopolymer transport system component